MTTTGRHGVIILDSSTAAATVDQLRATQIQVEAGLSDVEATATDVVLAQTYSKGQIDTRFAATETPAGAQAKADTALAAAKAYAETPAGAQAKADAAEADAKAYAGTLAYGTNLQATDATVAGFMDDPATAVGARATVVNVRSRGATGDGVTDDTAALQAAINAAATFGLAVFLPGGRYRITATINLPSGTTLRGVPGRSVIDITGLGATNATGSSGRSALQAVGTIEAAQAITADVTKGAKSVTLAATTTLARGDFVLLSSDQFFHVTAALKRGEIKRVEAVTSTQVTFEDATYDSYAAASGAKLAKITPVVGITLDGLTIEGTDADNNERGLFVEYGNDITVTRCTFNHTDWTSISLRNVTNFKVTDNTFRNVEWVSNTPNYYGLTVENASAHGTFSGNHGTLCRHLFTTGYTTTKPGVTRFVVASGNVDTYSQSGSFDTHDGCEFITFTGNTSSYSEANGISIESRETIVTDNQVINYSSTLGGIYVRAAAENVTVRGNRVVSTVSATYGIYVRRTYTHRPRRVHVTDNIIDVAANGNGIYLLDADECKVTGNQIGPCLNGVFLSGTNGCSVGDNDVDTAGYAFYVNNSTRTRVTGNRATSGTGAVYLSSSTRTIVANNDAGACTYGVRMAGTSDHTGITGNDFTGATTPVYNPLGTRKIYANLGVANSEV